MSDLPHAPSSTFLPKLLSPWNEMCFTRLLDSVARSRPQEIVFVDAPDTRSWLFRPARALTFAMLADESRRFARQMTSLGLKKGDSILVALPSSIEFPVAILGAMAAGLVPVPIALSLTPDQMRKAAELSHAQAIVTVSNLAGIFPALLMREIAAQVFSIRTVTCFGADVPDGVVALDGWEEADLDPLDVASQLRTDDISLISVEFSGDASRALCRTQGQLIAEAIALSSTAHISAKSKLLNMILPGSSFSLVAGIVLPLLLRAQMHYHGLFSSETLAQQVKASPGIIVIAPAAIEAGLAELVQAMPDGLGSVILLQRLENSALPAQVDPCLPGRVVDVTALGEAGHFMLPRKLQGRRAPLPQNWRQPGTRVVENDMLLLQAKLDDQDIVSLHGFGVPSLYGKPAGSSELSGLKTGFSAILSEGQTFLPYDPASDESDVEVINARTAA